MNYIDSLKDGKKNTGIYLCKSKAAATTKNGKEYETVTLMDKTGVIEGKIWEPNSMGIGEYEALDYVEVSGEVINYNGTLQYRIDRLRKADASEYDMADYIPSSRFSIEEMYSEFVENIKEIKNEYLKALLEAFFVKDKEFIEEFKKHSAAKSVHHSFMGGLLEHSLSVTRICAFMTKTYPVLNGDLLIASGMLHDVGKVYEISAFPQNDYTDEGNLLGHIVMGSELISDKIRQIPDFPKQLELEIKHCIIAHHGELEYGSPKKPALAEAVALNLADNMDAKMETLREVFSSKEGGDWMGYNKLFESNLKRTSK